MVNDSAHISRMANCSPSLLACLRPQERERLEALTLEARHRWSLHARPDQLPPPGNWTTWLLLAGRGAGKTRAGGEHVRCRVEAGQWGRVALVAPTAADSRDVMVEGESGLLPKAAPWFRPVYEPSKRRLTWPNGAIGTTYSADEPDRLRGPQHDGAWADELAVWRYADEAWAMLMLGLRLGRDPRCVVTTTPRPVRVIRDLLKQPTTVVTTASTYDNRANLAPAFFGQIIRRYENTRLGQQELYAKLLEDAPGALWKRDLLEETRVMKAPDLVRVVVAIDPAVTATEESDETGIVVAGLGVDGHGYVLDDRSLRASPDGWAREAIAAYHTLRADRIVAEVNNGGDMVENTLRVVDRNIPYRAIHASRGKQARAEPISALYEQKRVHHVGTFADLEDQLCQWVPGAEKSPDRLDALVWVLTELMLGEEAQSEDVVSLAERVEISPV